MLRRPPRSTLFPYTNALPIFCAARSQTMYPRPSDCRASSMWNGSVMANRLLALQSLGRGRSEEHTSELQSRPHLVCRLLLEKKNTNCEFRDLCRADVDRVAQH